MATALVTGRVADFGDAPIPGSTLNLTVTPERSGASSTGLHPKRTITVPVNEDGTWSVLLVPSTETRVRYVFAAQWTKDGVTTGHSWARLQPVWVPEGGGDIHDLFAAMNGRNPLMVYTSPTAPDDGVADQFQYNTTTGVLYTRSS